MSNHKLAVYGNMAASASFPLGSILYGAALYINSSGSSTTCGSGAQGLGLFAGTPGVPDQVGAGGSSEPHALLVPGEFRAKGNITCKGTRLLMLHIHWTALKD